MKNLIITLLFAMIATFASATNDTMTVVFYFDAQSSTLNQSQVDSIQTLIANNSNIVSVRGFANQLPNTVTNQNNVNLAMDRAFSVANITGTTDIDFTVVMSNSSLDRRVEITIVVNTMEYTYTDIYGNQVTLAEIVAGIDCQDNEESIQSNNIITTLDPITARIVKNESNKIPTYSSTTKGDIVIKNDNICGCSPVGGSLRDTWALYKSYQDSAQVYSNVDAGMKDLYTLKAREMRKCWKTMHYAYKYQVKMKANNPDYDVVKDMIRREVSTAAKVENSKSNQRRNKRKKTRLKRPFRLGDSVWIKMFPFSAC